MVEAGRALSVGTADDLTAHVLSWAGQSPWLGRLERVLYYGFYDLTQIQLAFFDAVTARVEATVYFPEADEPAFQFGAFWKGTSPRPRSGSKRRRPGGRAGRRRGPRSPS
jgi:ATP-dependent helicase/nuclease subunit B